MSAWLQIESSGKVIAHPERAVHDLALADDPRSLFSGARGLRLKGDITNGCNLRCPFCPNPKAAVPTPMPRALFDKVLALLPLAAGEDSWLVSCRYEPTIHPDFGRFLLSIPPEHRRKAAFTTNLAGSLTEETLAAIAAADLHHFNVSLDSWDADLYRRLRVGATLEAFTANLRRLVALRPRRMQFITLVFRANAEEVPSLVRDCAERYGAALHEVRLPQERTWPESEMLSLNEWKSLLDRLRQMPYRVLARNEWYRPFTCERIH